jgi:cytochrome c-type biogenesis protein CcmE
VSRPPVAVAGPAEEESADAAPLATATGGDPGARGPDAGPGAVPRGTRAAAGHRGRLLVVGALLVGAFAFLLVKGLGSSLDYFETVNQALAGKAMLGTKTFRLEGLVVPGSVERHRGGVDFTASGSRGRIEVVNTGNPPQLFQPDIPVVVVGHFAGDRFVSNQIIVDHSAQYVARYPQRVRAPNGSTR